MPISAQEGKDIIKKWFNEQEDIKTIVDIGCGAGTYPDLLGYDYEWIGVEAYEPYIKEYDLESKYDQIIIDDVLNIDMPDGDCIIFGDVLEHMGKYDVEILMDMCKNLYDHIVVSIPLGFWPQGAINGNIYETHLSEWSPREAEAFFNDFTVKERVGHIGIFIK